MFQIFKVNFIYFIYRQCTREVIFEKSISELLLQEINKKHLCQCITKNVLNIDICCHDPSEQKV